MKQKLSNQIKEWRKRKGLSQSQAAKLIGVPKRTLQNWELEYREPRGLTREALLGKLKE